MRLLYLLVFLLFILQSQLGYCQVSVQNLYFNSTTNILRLNFSGSSPTHNYTGIGSGASIGEGIAHVEDLNGNLKFWVNASGVYDKNGTLLPGSAGILAHPSSSEIVICPFPADPAKFYIFYNNQLCSALYYALVDMNLRGGLGEVVSKNIAIDPGNSYAEGLEIVKIPCSSDYWLLAYQCYSGFKRFKIDAKGISSSTLLQTFNAESHNGRGELDFHQGRLAYAVTYKNKVFLSDFDPVTGVISNAKTVSFAATNGLYGIEFSADASKVYASDWNNRNFFGNISSPNLFRYDIASGTSSSWTIPYNTANCQNTIVEGLGQIELGKDGKLYIPHVNGCQITVVENPNVATPTFSQIDVSTILSTGVSDHIQSEVWQALQISPDQTICEGERVELSIQGGNTYRWKPTTGLDDPYSSSPSAAPLVTTTYTVYAENQFGCLDSLQTTVRVIAKPKVSITTPQGTTLCEARTVKLMATPGYTSYQWYLNNQLISEATTDSLLISNEGIYYVEVSGSPASCQGISSQVEIIRSSTSIPMVTIHGKTHLCAGESTLLSTHQQSGYFYQWLKDNTALAGETTHQLTVKEAGTYQVKMQSIGHCEAVSAPIPIQVYPYPEISLPLDTTVCHTPLVLTLNKPTEEYTYLWSDNSTEPSLEVKQSGEYTLQVSNGYCIATRKITVQILDPGQVEIPNVITPNDDQSNDFFVVKNGFGKISLTIYNRWGKEVFRSSEYQNDWNAAGLSNGAYYYHLSGHSPCFKTAKGIINVLK
ncbi:gliding motility-associated C-terminal domain-containing protein [Rhodocytophaga aerolata]|uniref:Gliding motility-associated C-terminal domain-containing protein n=1 Tax=Rhodocytophaga aerolata TaxID=455078 RepID=A0ABT8RGJ9_9BACT|nr:gliding motility-associated C-terminal domain-containing protein [Rhodocytophaga aerolata]MDO1451229.1 gliding motility-associated C-terminal domain-containing protein [Rhodocytophaga aerolata]